MKVLQYSRHQKLSTMKANEWNEHRDSKSTGKRSRGKKMKRTVENDIYK